MKEMKYSEYSQKIHPVFNPALWLANLFVTVGYFHPSGQAGEYSVEPTRLKLTLDHKY
jgi:hypothetical protein